MSMKCPIECLYPIQTVSRLIFNWVPIIRPDDIWLNEIQPIGVYSHWPQ